MPGGSAVDDDFKDAADGVAGAQSEIDFGLHALLGLGVDAAEQNLFLVAQRRNLFPGGVAVQFGAADADDVAGDFDAQDFEQQLGDGAGGDPRGRLAGRCPLEHIAGVGKIVLERAGKVGVAGPRRGHGLVLCGIAGSDGQDLGPVLPVAVFDFDGNRRADGLAVAHAGEDVGGIGLDAHAAAAAVALLATPKLAVDEFLVDRTPAGSPEIKAIRLSPWDSPAVEKRSIVCELPVLIVAQGHG